MQWCCGYAFINEAMHHSVYKKGHTLPRLRMSYTGAVIADVRLPRTGAVMADVSTGELKNPIEHDDMCPLSLEPLNMAHAVYVTPCGHVFDDDRVEGNGMNLRNLAVIPTCPLCKMRITGIYLLGSLTPAYQSLTDTQSQGGMWLDFFEKKVYAAQAQGKTGLNEYIKWADEALYAKLITDAGPELQRAEAMALRVKTKFAALRLYCGRLDINILKYPDALHQNALELKSYVESMLPPEALYRVKDLLYTYAQPYAQVLISKSASDPQQLKQALDSVNWSPLLVNRIIKELMVYRDHAIGFKDPLYQRMAEEVDNHYIRQQSYVSEHTWHDDYNINDAY